MRELPEQVLEALIDYRERGEGDIAQLQRELAAAGWRLVPETILPRAGSYAEVAALLRNSAQETETSGYSSSGLNTTADHLQQLSAFAAAVLGVDLDDLAAHAEGGLS